MPNAYGYVWLSPEIRDGYAENVAEQSGQVLASYCETNNLQWQGLQRDHSLQRHPDERPILKNILKKMKAHDYLVVEDLLHLGRRFYDVYCLLQWFGEQKKGTLVAVQQTLRLTPENTREILSTFAQFPQLTPQEAKNTDPHTPPPKRSEVSRNNGGACPYGYQVNTQNEYELIQDEANTVRRIYKQRSRGHSLRQIVRDLSHQKVPTKRGGKWQPNTIKNILENPFYMGIYQTHYANFENNHPAIISQELYYTLNAHLLHDDIGM